MQPIFQSLLETDLYKFTMWQTQLHRHPQTQAEYTFVCRNRPIVDLSPLVSAVNEQLDHLCTLRFREDELAYLKSLRFIKGDFVEFLRLFQFRRESIEVSADGPHLKISAQGSQIHVMGTRSSCSQS